MKKEPLFELINSMTMSEKRFFKIFSNRHVIGDANQYLLLFNFIDQHTNINNKKLLEQEFVKNISAEKNYLYRLILKSLNAYYSEFSNKMKIQNLIISSEILAYKGLENQALKTLKKAAEIAEESELFSYLLTIKQTEFEILSKMHSYELAIKKVRDVFSHIKALEDLSETQLHASQAYNIRQKKGSIRSKQELNEIIQHQNTKELISKKSKLFNYSLNATQHNALKDFDAELNFLHQIAALYEENSFLMEYSIKGYISTLYNIANTYRNLKEYDKALSTLYQLNKLKEHKLVSSSKSLSAYLFYLSHSLRLYISVIKEDFEEAITHYHSIKKEYALHQENINKTVVYEHFMLIIRINIALSNFIEALKYSNIIINDNSFKSRADILTYVRLLNLIIHFELKNDFTLEYISLSTVNYLKRKHRAYKTEKEVINFITKYETKNSRTLNKINVKLKLLKEDALEKSMFNFFDFQKWCELKLETLKL
jgi:tetratricopeptide (TPR) repeat protein